MSEYLIQQSTLKNQADLLRKKLGISETINPKNFSNKIDSLGIVKKDFNFYDFDGTLLYSYTFDELKELTELPPAPSHEHLIFQEWNWSLAGLKAAKEPKVIGATYKTETGATYLFIDIKTKGNAKIPLHFKQYNANTITIDWGDGTISSNIATVGEQYIEHVYSDIGEYIIQIKTVNGSNYMLGNQDIATGVFGVRYYSTEFPNATYTSSAYTSLKRIYFGDALTQTTARCFDYYPNLEYITLPNTLKYIAGVSFFNTKSLKCAIIPKGCEFNGTGNFSGANNLETCSFPEGLINVPRSLFDYVYRLKNFHLPENMTVLSPYVFKMCTGIESLTLPSTLTTIGEHSLYGIKIDHIEIPNGVITIGDNAFQGIELEEIYLPDSVTSLGGGVFNSCNGLSKVRLSNSLTFLPASAFTTCYGITEIEIPPSVTALHSDVFYNCCNLSEVVFKNAEQVPTLANVEVFYGTPKNLKIKVPSNLLNEWKAATNWSAYADQIIGV